MENPEKLFWQLFFGHWYTTQYIYMSSVRSWFLLIFFVKTELKSWTLGQIVYILLTKLGFFQDKVKFTAIY